MTTKRSKVNGVKKEMPKREEEDSEEEEEDLLKDEEEEEMEAEQDHMMWDSGDEVVADQSMHSTSSKSGGGGGGGGMNKQTMLRFGEILAEPIPKRYTCEALCKMIDRGQIDLEPEYQRGVVWKVDKQSAVIDSIYRNCYVPPILLSIHSEENEDGESSELRICVDGKQRLSSIHLFMKNKIPLREPGTNRSFWFSDRKKTFYLTDSQRMKFSQININCIEYHNLDEERERDMFQRVQMGVTLTPAEKISANLGPWPDFVRELVKRFVDNEALNLRHVIALDRGRDFMYMAMITLLILNCKEKNFLPLASAVTRFFKAGGAPLENQRKVIIAAMSKLTVLSNDQENNGPLLPIKLRGRQAKSLAPIEFLFTAYVCFRFPRANNAQLSVILQGMEARVRGEHADVFMNTRVERTFRNFIKEMEVQYPFLLSVDGVSKAKKRRREAINEDGNESGTPAREILPTATS